LLKNVRGSSACAASSCVATLRGQGSLTTSNEFIEEFPQEAEEKSTFEVDSSLVLVLVVLVVLVIFVYTGSMAERESNMLMIHDEVSGDLRRSTDSQQNERQNS
jgi:hypothetical protein